MDKKDLTVAEEEFIGTLKLISSEEIISTVCYLPDEDKVLLQSPLQVETALNEAQDKLREALAFAARSEKPYISKHISDMMMKIDCLNEVSNLIDHVEDTMKQSD